MNLSDRIETIRADYAHCFGCGSENPVGLGLTGFVNEGGAITAEFVPRTDYHGFNDVLHGGIVATALDEIMAWTAILLEGVMVMTGTLELRYRKPAAVDTCYKLEGRLEERRGRRLRLAGRVLEGPTAVAEAWGLFLVVADLADEL